MPEPPKVIGIVGHIGRYDPKSMEWSTYKGMVTFYLQPNSITDAALKRATLLTFIKDIAYRMLADLHLHDELSTVNFDTLIADLDSAYGKNSCKTHHGYVFSRSSSMRANQSTSTSQIFVIRQSIVVSAINLAIASQISSWSA